MWILIIMLWGGSTSGGVHTQTIEFHNQSDCNNAAQAILQRAGRERFDVRTICVERRRPMKEN